MRVLFTGGIGVISTAASLRAIAKGSELYLLNRDPGPKFCPVVTG